MPGPYKETDLTERVEAFLSDLKRGGSGTGPLRGSAETARETTALLRRITAQARWSSAGALCCCYCLFTVKSKLWCRSKAGIRVWTNGLTATRTSLLANFELKSFSATILYLDVPCSSAETC